MMEFWNIESWPFKVMINNKKLNPSLHYSITPLFHYSMIEGKNSALKISHISNNFL
jgi:hypothetical protein